MNLFIIRKYLHRKSKINLFLNFLLNFLQNWWIVALKWSFLLKIVYCKQYVDITKSVSIMILPFLHKKLCQKIEKHISESAILKISPIPRFRKGCGDGNILEVERCPKTNLKMFVSESRGGDAGIPTVHVRLH